MKKKKWTMPKWLEPYLFFMPCHKKEIEDYMNCSGVNCSSFICLRVNIRIHLLESLYIHGRLK